MKILFVCTGNTCRSCMAEAIFNKISDVPETSAISAGISVVKGSKTSLNSAAVVKENLSLDISNRAAVQLVPSLIEEADLVLTMTVSARDFLKSMNRNFLNKIYSLKEYVGRSGDIIDPYGADIDVYRETFKELNSVLKLLIGKLKEDKSIN